MKEQLAALEMKSDSNATHYRSGTHEKMFEGKSTYKRFVKGDAELFYFDPNTLPEEGWKRLGVREKTIQTIRKYIDKGGRFRRAEDIKNIWGLHEQQIQRLLPFVKIKPEEKLERQFESVNKPIYEKRKPAIVDINLADTSVFIALPWIGSKLAKRIVDFRDKLGGFKSIDQLSEVFGLQDSVLQKIKPQLMITNEQIKQLNINAATLEELKAHPYIRYHFANAIIQYRNQHGNFADVADLRKILIITEEWYNKVYPYLTVK